jgi:hypothetical protein
MKFTQGILFVVCLSSLAGCSSTSLRSVETPVPIHGKVSLPSGGTLNAGLVSFIPNNSPGARNDSIAIKNGEYKLDMVPGKYKIVIEPQGSQASLVPKKYTRPDMTDIEVEISSSTTEIPIVLAK